MSLSAKIRRAPVRAVTGAYILNTGIDKIRGSDEMSKSLHGFASSAFPAFEKIDSKLFTRSLGIVEIGIGTTLLLPVASPVVAGAALMAFSGGLLGLYWRTPAMHRGANDPRPTQDGIAFAKDSWLFGIGSTLVLDAMLDNARAKRIEVVHDLSKSTAVRAADLRGRRRLAQARVRELRANARARTAVPAAKATAYLNSAKGMTKRAARSVG
jgi:uncharacterized membrane protein YphA (DoxX/SURF4 family)